MATARIDATAVETEEGPQGGVIYVLDAYTIRGEIYRYMVDFFGPDAKRRAERLAATVLQAGVITLEFWEYQRTMYGSIAWDEGGFEMAEIEREWEEDGRPALFI